MEIFKHMQPLGKQNAYYAAAVSVLAVGILFSASIVFAGYGTPYGTPYSSPYVTPPVCTTTWVWVPSQVSNLPGGPCETSTCTAASGGGGSGALQVATWIDAVPRLVRAGGSSMLEWGSTNAASCAIKLAGATVFTGLSGQETLSNILEQRTYILECAMIAGGTETSSVTISIIPMWREF